MPHLSQVANVSRQNDDDDDDDEIFLVEWRKHISRDLKLLCIHNHLKRSTACYIVVVSFFIRVNLTSRSNQTSNNWSALESIACVS